MKKVCPECQLPKDLTEFGTVKNRIGGYSSYCTICKNNKQQQYYNNNKDKLAKEKRDYNANNRKKVRFLQKQHRNKYPWKETLHKIKQRCFNKNCAHYHNYGGRGIKCLITSEELKELWFRDKAYLMDKPSIDREDNDGDYEYSNCRYIEKNENSARSSRKTVLQCDLKGTFIREWESQTEASIQLKISQSHISNCCNEKYNHAGGFKWKFK